MAFFHITTLAAWNEALSLGLYRAPSLATQGFIHLSTNEQWRRSAVRFFRGRADLLLLTVEPEKLRADVVFEAADGEQFPHLYGELDLDAVQSVVPFRVGEDGSIEMLEGSSSAV